MAQVDIMVGGRNYAIKCRDGGEAHLRSIAALVDGKTSEARAAVGDVNESRQLLFAALLLADEMSEAKSGETPAAPDPQIVAALERLADRIEAVADMVEGDRVEVRALHA